MNLSTCRNRTKSDGKILFPALECWNPMTMVASIAAQVDGKRVICRISASVLQEKFNASKESPMQSVRNNRRKIEDAARLLIEKKAFEDDGSISIEVEHL